MSERYSVVVVGAGPAGLSAAYFSARKGLDVVVLERGSEPGSKNVFGGRIYSYALDRHFPGWRGEAPVERWVRREKLSILCGDEMVGLEYEAARPGDGGDSFTTFLSRFLKWMSSKVEEAGGTVAAGVRVDEIIFTDGRASGVRVGDEKLQADYVVVAEGANTLLLETHGLREKPAPKDLAVGVKEVIRLGKEKIDERFGLRGEEGLAQLIVLPGVGGGFIYTMRECVSLGVVCRPLYGGRVEVKDVVEELRTAPPVFRLVGDGVPIEYSAHIIREAGYRDLMARPYGEGYLVVGDAAGLILNTGFTVRGVDLAIESGRLAAEAIERAMGGEDLSVYWRLLNESGIVPTLKKFRRAQEVLSDPRVYDKYPELACKVFRKIYGCDALPETLYGSLIEAAGGRLGALRLLMSLARMVRKL